MIKKLCSFLKCNPSESKFEDKCSAHKKNIYLGLNGIPLKHKPKDNIEYLFYNALGNWEFSKGDMSLELDSSYAHIYTGVQKLLWGSSESFLSFHMSINPYWEKLLVESGRNPESNVSTVEFNKILNTIDAHEDRQLIFKFLYTFDVYSLIGNIQELTKEIKFFAGEFYRIINLEPSFIGLPDREKVGTRHSMSPVTTKLSGVLGLIFIRFHSLLDFHTKLTYEIIKIKNDFSIYPKLACSKILYGHTNYLALENSETENTLFYRDKLINQIESYRNELIHNSLLDDAPRLYERYENFEVVERYMLMPDVDENGHLKRFVNRNFFYSEENKFNLLLPEMLRTFQQRQLNTALLIQKLCSIKEPSNAS